MKNIQQYFPGFLLISALAAIGWVANPYIPYVNEVILGLLLGMLIANLVPLKDGFRPGVNLVSGKGLELAILFLSFSINYRNIGALGWQTFAVLFLILAGMMWLGIRLSKSMNCPGKSGILISFGTLICGSSAIAALAPQIKSSEEDTGISMAVVNLLGTLFMLILPLFATQFDAEEIAMLIGGSLHAVGNVAGAGYAVSPEVSEMAIAIKLARVAMLTPALFWMQFLLSEKKTSGKSIQFKLPWYLIGFILITVVNSVFQLPKDFIGGAKTIGEIILTLAMVAIGMKISFRDLIISGRKGLVFGLVFYLIFAGIISLSTFMR